uniref:autocrine proliferation repressor protein A n=1 Tax=Ciona intestinalis TaxID=7719 RepID=UPI000052112F|nr:autocrine proliferation repressor protein A [Ciona intestinalis]|eukprot:XP_002128778.1 autocrine proliferation repressor protein A [Ciona intestinalis]
MLRTEFFFALCLFGLVAVQGNPLDDYVMNDDGHYSYTVLRDWTYKSPGHTSYLINMTSQQWLTPNDTDRSLWWHFVIVHVPDEFDPALSNSAFLLIDGGGNDNPDNPPEITDTFVMFTGLMAESSKSIVVDLKQIPNEHMTFKHDPKKQRRTEDAIIAYTWRHFLENPNQPEWLLRMPMTKASVKAMDAVTDFINKTVGNQIERWCVGGASKRGWTTWTTAAVDKRVQCMTPIVMDELNMVKNLHHHYRAYGGWSFAFKDYYDEDITKDLDHPNMPALAAIVDPLSYVDRLTMPKMVFSTGGDEFFLPDDSHYYLTSMKGPMYVNMLPNAEHSCVGHELQLMFNIKAFYVSVMKGKKLPQATWTLYNTATGGGIDVTLDTVPTLIRAWSVTSISSKRRDFRLLRGNTTDVSAQPIVQPNIWHHSNVTSIGHLKYRAEFDTPLFGRWRAFFIQMTFPASDGNMIEFTTETNIIPDKFPYPDCYKDSCKGTLV